MSGPRVLSVGQCGFDHASIARLLSSRFRAEVEAAATADEALPRLRAGRFDLVLVNRVGDRDGRPGVELIRALKVDPALATVPVMLVSNYAEAQDEAVALGALPGFGKASLHDPATHRRLAATLGEAAEPGPLR